MFTKDIMSTHYLSRYEKFIAACKSQQVDGYVERHHIIPRSLGGSNDSTNLVKMTARQHFIAHLILSKVFCGNSGIKMEYAIWNMVNRDGGKRTNSRTYEKLKIRRQQMLSERMRGENNHMFGKKHSSETRDHISRMLTGKKKPESQREKLRIRNSGSGNPQYGKPKNDRQLEVSRKNFLEKNPMWREEVKEKIRISKGTSVNCFDLEQNAFVRISAEEFNSLKGIKYIGANSGKIPAEFKRNQTAVVNNHTE